MIQNIMYYILTLIVSALFTYIVKLLNSINGKFKHKKLPINPFKFHDKINTNIIPTSDTNSFITPFLNPTTINEIKTSIIPISNIFNIYTPLSIYIHYKLFNKNML